MATVNAYITFNGNCEKAFNFYKSVFGGDFMYVGRYKDMPEQSPIAACEANKIMHIALPISKETILMGSDTCCEKDSDFDSELHFGNNISIYVTADSEKEANSIFEGLSKDGRINMPLQKTFWNAYFGMLIDQFGINWMIGYDYPQE